MGSLITDDRKFDAVVRRNVGIEKNSKTKGNIIRVLNYYGISHSNYIVDMYKLRKWREKCVTVNVIDLQQSVLTTFALIFAVDFLRPATPLFKIH